MTTRTPTGRTTDLSDLAAVKAGQAIRRLRQRLMPMAWSAGIEDVDEAAPKLVGPLPTRPEVCDLAISPAGRRGVFAQPQEGLPARQAS